LCVRSASGDELPFKGWVSFCVQVNDVEVDVPFLVTNSEIESPILGFNVITYFQERDELVRMLKGRDGKTISSVQSVLRDEQEGHLGEIKCGRQNVTIPGGTTKSIRCQVRIGAREDQVALFSPVSLGHVLEESLEISETLVKVTRGASCSVSIPVSNTSNKPVTLRRGQALGQLTAIKSVVTLRCPEFSGKEDEEGKRETKSPDASRQDTDGADPQEDIKNERYVPGDSWDPPVNIDESKLTPDQI
jgi:hypothetical protein